MHRSHVVTTTSPPPSTSTIRAASKRASHRDFFERRSFRRLQPAALRHITGTFQTRGRRGRFSRFRAPGMDREFERGGRERGMEGGYIHIRFAAPVIHANSLFGGPSKICLTASRVSPKTFSARIADFCPPGLHHPTDRTDPIMLGWFWRKSLHHELV